MRSRPTATVHPSGRGGARPGAGRKATFTDAHPYKVNLEAETAARLKLLGNGNLSAGVRFAAANAVVRELGQVSTPIHNAAADPVCPSTVAFSATAIDHSGLSLLDPLVVGVGPYHGRHEASLQHKGMLTLKKDLARTRGNLIPVLVHQKLADGNAKYELVYGRRRLQGCLELGIPVRVIVRQMNDTEGFLAMMVEAASNWSAFEIGTSLRRALDSGLFLSQRRLVEVCGLENSFVRAALSIVALPPVVLRAFASPTSISVGAIRRLDLALARDSDEVLRRAERLTKSERLAPAKVLAALSRPVTT